jgi:hypothetical protein
MKKSVRFWASVVSVAIAFAGFGWELHRGRYPWRDMFSLDHLHHPLRDLFDVCVLIVMIVLGIQVFIDKRKQKRRINSQAEWHRSLDAIVDLKDFKDADCLYGYLGPDERKRLMQALERMPRGSRSLQKAVRIVSPELIDDAAEQSACT